MFLPFLPVTVAELLSLIAEADTMETKRRVLGTLNVVIERAGIHVRCLQKAPIHIELKTLRRLYRYSV